METEVWNTAMTWHTVQYITGMWVFLSQTISLQNQSWSFQNVLFPEMVNHRQCNWIENHLGNIPLSVTMSIFPERFNWGKKSHPECGWHCPKQDSRLNEKERVSWAPVLISFCFLTRHTLWPAPSSCHHACHTMYIKTVSIFSQQRGKQLARCLSAFSKSRIY